ncbi:Acetolactate synthase isozyme 2 large subunit [subsurface metagenome]
MIRVADYVFKTLVDYGIRHVFMVVGGGAMYLNDAIGRNKRIKYICNHHEQACTMAAEGYARVTGKIGVACVTTGPGGINALNGVYGAWTDSIPMLIISGQVKKETCICCYDLPGLRQLGDQETDIISLAKEITKYAVLVEQPYSIRYHLEKALFLSTSGRPGPCWLDVPIDVQSSIIDVSRLSGYNPAEDSPTYDMQLLAKQCEETIRRIRSSSRPVIMVGTGIRLAGALDIFETVIRKLGIPVTTAWTAHDMMPSDDPFYCGRPGTVGGRAGNFTVQNSDTLLVIGCRLNIRQVSYNWKAFAPRAFKIQVDVDQAELEKPTVKPDLPICCDAKLFLEEMNRQLNGFDSTHHSGWLSRCKERVRLYPVVLPKHRVKKDGVVNPYHFIDVLFKQLSNDDVVVCGNGSASVISFQVAQIKKGLRMFCNSGNASMGYGLPASIGAAVARGGKRVICLAGDGSIQMNIQELQTIVHHQLPVKIFVLNNRGYLSIRITQKTFFKGDMMGCGPESGVSFPDMLRIGQAYGITSMRIDQHDFIEQINTVLNTPGPVLCEVVLDPDQFFEPKLSSRRLEDGSIVSPQLEDMSPFLDKEELLSNLLIS